MVVGLAIAAVLALLACACGAGKVLPLMSHDNRAYKQLPGEKKRRHDKKAAELPQSLAMTRGIACYRGENACGVNRCEHSGNSGVRKRAESTESRV